MIASRFLSLLKRHGLCRDASWAGGEEMPEAQGISTMCRVRLCRGSRVFDFGFVSPVRLIGHAARGYDDIPGGAEIDLLWCATPSPRHSDWKRRMFRPCPRHEIRMPDGTWQYWSRSLVSLEREPNQYGRLAIHQFAARKNFR